jgi:hypothetical protein
MEHEPAVCKEEFALDWKFIERANEEYKRVR